MDIELSNSQKFSSSYQVVPGNLPRKGMASTGEPYKDDIEGGPLVREHAASLEDSLRYRSRSGDYNDDSTGGSPPFVASPAATGADDFIDIKVSQSASGVEKRSP